MVRGDELAQLVAVVTRGERLDKGGVLEGGQAGVGWFFQADGVQCGVQRVLFLEDKQPRAEVAVVVGAGVLVSAPARGSVPDEGLVILDQTRLGRVQNNELQVLGQFFFTAERRACARIRVETAGETG